MRLPLLMTPDEIIQQYQLQQLVTADGRIYIKIQKEMYGLKQAGILANQRLQRHLETHGYFPTPRTPGLWKHATCDVHFSLVADNFGVRYVGKENAHHLVDAPASLY
jgi:hypothetical protein